MDNITEEEARKALLGESNGSDITNFTPTPAPVSSIGHVTISHDALPSKGLYYDPNMTIQIRSANNAEIKHYSGMDDSNPLEVEKHISAILSTCCIVSNGNTIMSYRDLSEFDKIYTFFAIRDRTFLRDKRDSNINVTAQCQHCGHDNTVTISNDTFGFYSISANLLKYYNAEQRCFIIADDSIGSDPLKFYIPTVGVTEKIMEYIKQQELSKQQGGEGYYNPNDLTILMYITPNWREIDDKGKYIRQQTSIIKDRWNHDRYAIATEFTKRLKVGIKPTITFNCSNCDGEVTTAIRFQRWGTLFSNESKLRELFGDTELYDLE